MPSTFLNAAIAATPMFQMCFTSRPGLSIDSSPSSIIAPIHLNVGTMPLSHVRPVLNAVTMPFQISAKKAVIDPQLL